MLRSAGAQYAPRADEKARARQRLMAMLAQPQEATAPLGRLAPPVDPAGDTPTTVMPALVPAVTAQADEQDHREDAVETVVPAGRPGRRSGRHTLPTRPAGRAPCGTRTAGRGLRRRVVLVGTAALVALVALAGGGIFASRDALPGDALYGVKRVVESAGLAMTFDKTAKARRQLDLAAIRLDEVEKLVGSGRSATAADPELVRSAMQDFDASAGDGSRSLMGGEDAGGKATLGDLQAWAGEQAARLSVLRSSLPSSTVPGADDSITHLDRLRGRTEALNKRSSCTQVTSGTVDDLGPLPAEGACSPRPVDPQSTAGPGATQDGTGTPGRSATDPSTAGRAGGTDDPGVAPTTDPAPGLVPGTGNLPGSGSPTTTPSSPSNITIPLPLPLLPPINLPPLLPGQPGITIG
jgi:hypothetical protein